MEVPKGSIFGPFLFLIYVDIFPFYVLNLRKTALFVDDASSIYNIDRLKTNFDGLRVQNWVIVTYNLMQIKQNV